MGANNEVKVLSSGITLNENIFQPSASEIVTAFDDKVKIEYRKNYDENTSTGIFYNGLPVHQFAGLPLLCW